jgi:spore maturation protein CgeB
VPIYNAVDADTHHPAQSEPRFSADLGLLANRLPDREARIDQFFLLPADRLPNRRFVLGGSGWGDKKTPQNVFSVGHVYTHEHNAFNCSSLALLNISRDSMASYGFSPATRVFEVAGAGACLITDDWKGIELFLEPGSEILVARNGQEVAEHLESLTAERAHAIGAAARRRVLAEHTYAHRAAQLQALLDRKVASPRNRAALAL